MDSKVSRTITLHNGVRIPEIGYRVDRDHHDQIYNHIRTALDAGFRHFDLPVSTEAERLAAKAFADSGIPRYELYLTMKLPNSEHGYDRALRAFNNSLKRLDTDYADIYLINWPNPAQYRDRYEEVFADTWRALETLYKSGAVRAIGLANCEARHIEQILVTSEIAPMVNQARIYPGFPFNDNLMCANEHSIQTIGFLPPDHKAILESRELKIFADKYHVTPRQICIRYLLEKGCLALCQGKDLSELKDCVHVFDFSLTEDDMKFLDHMKNYGMEMIDPDTCDF
jgi:diketogulonate reductase-like aldo/keto reductase